MVTQFAWILKKQFFMSSIREFLFKNDFPGWKSNK